MSSEQTNVERISVPKGFSPVVINYLITLFSKKSSLMVKKGNLRGRQYTQGTVSEIEANIATSDIKNLISQGYLIKKYDLEGYTVLVPHPFVLDYLRSKGAKKNFSVDNPFEGDIVKFGHFREPNVGERSELKSKGKVIKAPCHPNLFKREAFRNGYNYSDIFCFVKENSPCYVMLGVKDTQFYQVYPKDVYKAIKLNKVEPKKSPIAIEYEITDSEIRIVSESTSTSYIIHTKKQYPTFDKISENYKLAKKYLKENSVRTFGKKETEAILSDFKYAEIYSNFLTEYDRLFSDLLKLSKELVKEGVVSGGSNNNPIYKQALEVQSAMASIRKQPAVNTLLDKNNTFENIITLQSNEELDRYIKIEI